MKLVVDPCGMVERQTGELQNMIEGNRPQQDSRTWRVAVAGFGVIVVLSACQQKVPATEGLAAADADIRDQGAARCLDVTAGTGGRVLFDYDSAELRPDVRNVLDAAATRLQELPDCRIVIEGHCDERGTRDYNLALGEKRAQTVVTYLAALGVDMARMETISYGKERPAVLGSDETAWSRNRRAQIVVE